MKTSVKYEELASKIREQIAAGVYMPGTAIPSQPQLVEIYKVSQITVRKAVDQLANEGYVRKGLGRGNGTVVLERSKLQKMTRLTYNFGIFGDARILDITDHDIPAVAKGIVFGLERWNASLSMFPFLSERHPSPVDYAKTLIARNMIDGLYVADCTGAEELCEYLKNIRFPFVCLQTMETRKDRFNDCAYPAVQIRERKMFSKLLKNYRKCGCRDVVLFAAQDDLFPGRTHELLELCCLEAGLPYRKVNMLRETFPILLRSLEKEIAADRLIVSSNTLMLRLDDALCLLGPKVPENLNLLFYKHYADKLPILNRKYAVLDRPFEKVGLEAARMMHGLMKRKETGMELCTGERVELNIYATVYKERQK